VIRWFAACVNQPAFKSILGAVAPCKKELLAPDQGAPDNASKNDGKVGGKKEIKKEAKEAPPTAPKKVEHPFTIMDKKSPSPFSMDAWKKQYSNAATYADAMNEKIDAEGYSLWYQNLNYKDEKKCAFMMSNAIGGFQQCSEEVRKWAFGVMDMIGIE